MRGVIRRVVASLFKGDVLSQATRPHRTNGDRYETNSMLPEMSDGAISCASKSGLLEFDLAEVQGYTHQHFAVIAVPPDFRSGMEDSLEPSRAFGADAPKLEDV